jgi:hypothetical protein
MIDMPERVNVIRTMTYNIPLIIEGMKELGWTDEEITEDIIYQYIEDCVDEDFRNPPSRHDMVWQDENGEEL